MANTNEFFSRKETDRIDLAGDTTSEDILKTLAKDESSRVREVVALNPHTPKETLTDLSQDESFLVRRNLVWNDNTPKNVLLELAMDKDSGVRKAVAVHADTPAEILAALSKDKDNGVRGLVAGNIDTPPEVLAALSQDEDPMVLASIALNPNTPTAALATLTQVLEDLSKNKDNEIAQSATRKLELLLEQNDNMLDGIINNGANDREIPGTYDDAEREMDQLIRDRMKFTLTLTDKISNEVTFKQQFTREETGELSGVDWSSIVVGGVGYDNYSISDNDGNIIASGELSFDLEQIAKTVTSTDREMENVVYKNSQNIWALKALELTGTEYIAQLRPEQQERLEAAISKIEGADVEKAMNGRLADLEENLDWQKELNKLDLADRIGRLQSDMSPNYGDDAPDFPFTRRSILNTLDSGETQELEFAINDMKGFVSDNEERLAILDAVREYSNLEIQKIELTEEEQAVMFGTPEQAKEAMEKMNKDSQPLSDITSQVITKDTPISSLPPEMQENIAEELHTIVALTENMDGNDYERLMSGTLGDVAEHIGISKYMTDGSLGAEIPKVAEKMAQESITVSISPKLVSEKPFAAKDGNSYFRVKIPNEDKNDKTPWASFVVTPDRVTTNSTTGKIEIKLNANGSSTLFKPELVGRDQTGKALYINNKQKVPNKDIKSRIERPNVKNLIAENKSRMESINHKPEKQQEQVTNKNKGMDI
ncbi:MAG: DUF4316 domain-containing protein [Lachnospiraceae bacterium]|nr:DUF4316 domain-containing protein [Lachnospiraceae bacterium]